MDVGADSEWVIDCDGPHPQFIQISNGDFTLYALDVTGRVWFLDDIDGAWEPITQNRKVRK